MNLGGLIGETLPHHAGAELGCRAMVGASLRLVPDEVHSPRGRIDPPYRKLCGREYGGSIAESGETVLLHLQHVQHKIPKRWEKGIWLGKMSSTDARL